MRPPSPDGRRLVDGRDRPGQRSARSAASYGDDFGCDGERGVLRGDGAQVEADRVVQAGEQVRVQALVKVARASHTVTWNPGNRSAPENEVAWSRARKIGCRGGAVQGSGPGGRGVLVNTTSRSGPWFALSARPLPSTVLSARAARVVPTWAGALPRTATEPAMAKGSPWFRRHSSSAARSRKGCLLSSGCTAADGPGHMFFAPVLVASRIRVYVPQRQMLRISWRSRSSISRPSAVACRTLATAARIWPGWQ